MIYILQTSYNQSFILIAESILLRVLIRNSRMTIRISNNHIKKKEKTHKKLTIRLKEGLSIR